MLDSLATLRRAVHLTFFGSFVFHGMQIAGFAVNDLFAAYARQNSGRQK